MPIYKGSQRIGALYRGGTKIGRVYHGSTLVYDSAGGTGDGPFSASRWRLNISATQGSSASEWIRIAEIEYRGSIGGTDLTGSGTASASASNPNGTENPGNAYDNNSATAWATGTGTKPQWIEYDFGTAVAPAEVAITIANIGNPSSAPRNFTIEYHDGATWQVAATVTDCVWTANGETQVVPIATAKTASDADRWRLLTTAKQNAGAWTAWAEIEFKVDASGGDLSQSAKAFANAAASGAAPANAFDNSTATKWSNGSTANGNWVGCINSSAAAIGRVVATSSSTANDSVTAFDVQYFNGWAWTTYWSVSSTNWGATETRTFDKP